MGAERSVAKTLCAVGRSFLAVFDPGENFGALFGERGSFKIDLGALGGDEVFRVGGGFRAHFHHRDTEGAEEGRICAKRSPLVSDVAKEP